jgi:hypothetical protein
MSEMQTSETQTGPFDPQTQPFAEQDIPRRRLTPLSVVISLGVVGLLIVLGLQLIAANRSQPNSGPAPDFTLHVFEDMNADAYLFGDRFTLSEHRAR